MCHVSTIDFQLFSLLHASVSLEKASYLFCFCNTASPPLVGGSAPLCAYSCDNGHHASHRGDLLEHRHGLWPALAPTWLLRPHKGDTQVIQENYWSVVIVEAALGLISIKSQNLPQVTYFDYGIHINLNISVNLISKLMRQHAVALLQSLSIDCIFLGFFSF